MGWTARRIAGFREPRPHARPGLPARLARGLVILALRTLFELRLEGRPPAAGGYVVIANHQGWSDPFVLLALFPATPRLYFFADRQAVLNVWWKRVPLRLLGGIVLVDRSGPMDRSAVEGALAVVRSGAVLGLFPEGRVSRAEASLGPFQRGVGYLALKTGAPILPVWLRGTAELYLKRPLTATVGPLRSTQAGTAITKDATEVFTRRLFADMDALALPWIEPAGVTRRWRWLTNIL